MNIPDASFPSRNLQKKKQVIGAPGARLNHTMSTDLLHSRFRSMTYDVHQYSRHCRHIIKVNAISSGVKGGAKRNITQQPTSHRSSTIYVSNTDHHMHGHNLSSISAQVLKLKPDLGSRMTKRAVFKSHWLPAMNQNQT